MSSSSLSSCPVTNTNVLVPLCFFFFLRAGGGGQQLFSEKKLKKKSLCTTCLAPNDKQSDQVVNLVEHSAVKELMISPQLLIETSNGSIILFQCNFCWVVPTGTCAAKTGNYRTLMYLILLILEH